MYQGDIRLDQTIDWKFCTVNTTGVPTTLTASTIVLYTTNSTVQITTGITVTTNFDSIPGLNHIRIVATTTNGFTNGTDVFAVIEAGTVGGNSVVGYPVGNFSILHRSPLSPTVHGRLLDVSAAGNAGIDWANVENPTAVNTLSNTTIADIRDVGGDVLGNINGNMAGDVQGNVDGNVGGTVAVVISVGAGAINSGSFAAGAIDAAALASDAGQEIADEILNRNIAGGGSGNTRNVRNALRRLRNRVAIAAGVATVYQENDTSAAWDAAITTAAGDPVIEMDPS